MTLPAKYSSQNLDETLASGTPEQFKVALAALLNTFPLGQTGGSQKDLVAAYLDTLQGEPAWAVTAAVRKFIHGKIEGHDGRFLPTSAQLGKAVRAETDWHRQQQAAQKAERKDFFEKTAPLTADQMASRREQVDAALSGAMFNGPSHDRIMFADYPACRRRRRWPDGTVLNAQRGVIEWPDGTEISYGEWWHVKHSEKRAHAPDANS